MLPKPWIRGHIQTWLGSVVVGRRTCDREVAGSTPATALFGQQLWADPDGGLQTNGCQKWPDQVSFVSLAGYIPKCNKTCMKSNKIVYVIPKNHLRLGLCPRPHWGNLQCSPKPLVSWGVGKPKTQTSSCQRLWCLTLSSSAGSPMCPAQNNFLDPPLATTLGKLYVALFTKQYNLVHCEGLHAKAPYCGSGIESNEQGEYSKAVLKRFCRIAKNRDINYLLYFYFYITEK